MRVFQVTLEELEAQLAAQHRRLLLFSLDVCEPCTWIKASLTRVAPDLSSIEACGILTLTYGVDHEDARLQNLGVRHFPTLVMYERGAVLGILRGAVTKSGPLNEARLIAWLERTGGEPALALAKG